MSHHESSDEVLSHRKRIHKRTLAMVFCFLILPWVLVAIPGESGTKKFIATGLSSQSFVHGWPFVHLDRTEAIVTGLPGQTQELNLAINSSPNQSAFRLDLRFDQEHVWRTGSPPSLGPKGFWTDPINWPCWGTGRYLRIRPLGLICNLLILGLTVSMLGWIVERKIRRDNRLIKFSLKSMLVAMTVIAVATIWVVKEYSDSLDQRRRLTRLTELEIPQTSVMYQSRFPQVVSQLLNHGYLLGLDPWFFVEINKESSGATLVHLSRVMTDERLSEIASAVVESPIPTALYLWPYTRQIENKLIEFEHADVKMLFVHFDDGFWIESFIDDPKYTGDFDRDLNTFRDQINIEAAFPKLEFLNLVLDPKLDQRSQLRAFCGLETLKTNQLVGLTKEGIDFLVKTKKRWPKKIHVMFDDNVSQSCKELLGQNFEVSTELVEF